MQKLRHGQTGGSRVRQIMTIHDGLGGGVTRLRYDIIYEQIHLKKTPKNSLNLRRFFKLGTSYTRSFRSDSETLFNASVL